MGRPWDRWDDRFDPVVAPREKSRKFGPIGASEHGMDVEVVPPRTPTKETSMTLSRTLARPLATLSLIGALVAPATLIAAPSKAAVDTQNDFIMSDGRICNPRWGCNGPDLMPRPTVLP